MILVDSHCHLDCLDLSHYKNDLTLALNNANAQEVNYFLCVCITLDQFDAMQNKVKGYRNVFTTVGTHPNEVVKDEVSVEALCQKAADSKVVGIGETGLDYFRSEGDLDWQRTRFRTHIRAAKELQLPLIIHSRLAPEDTIRIMQEERADTVGGVMHCFTETWEMAKQAMDLNFLISFSGIITFQNASELREVVQKIPLDHMLIETDSPYLAPVPYRGKTNEPAYVRFVAEKIAALKNETLETVAEKTSHNFFNLFKKAVKQ